jgi:hypothetical protein
MGHAQVQRLLALAACLVETSFAALGMAAEEN